MVDEEGHKAGDGVRPAQGSRTVDVTRGWRSQLSGVISLPSPLMAILVFCGFFVPAALTLHFLGSTTPIWVSNAIVVALLLRNALPTWPGLLLVLAISHCAVNVFFIHGVAMGIGVVILDTTEIMCLAGLLHYVSRSAPLFSSLGQICRFGLVCTLVHALSAAVGALLLLVLHGVPFLPGWTNWFLGGFFGLIVLVPFLLLWADTSQTLRMTLRARSEVLLLALVVGLVGCVDFGVPDLPGMFLSFPFLLLAAFHGGLLGATTAAVVLVVVASGFTLSGSGPIAVMPGASVSGHLLLLQLYSAVVLLSTLPVAIMLEQRKLLNAETLSEFSRMARHDVLTGLPNRVLFQERMEWTQAQARRSGAHTALLMFDLDRFKPVNDLYGHAAGDRLLQLVADRVRATVRETDTIARLGGDEFAVIGNIECPDTAQNVALRVIAALGQPFEFSGLMVQIGCSVGIALSPSGSIDPELLVQRADAALYRAKAEGRNCFRFFEPGMDVKVRERAELETELRHAISRDDLAPYYQPIVVLGSSHLVGFEILARWMHPTLGDVSPAVFIPVAESAGPDPDIDRATSAPRLSGSAELAGSPVHCHQHLPRAVARSWLSKPGAGDAGRDRATAAAPGGGVDRKRADR